jgi:hypothetical protein
MLYHCNASNADSDMRSLLKGKKGWKSIWIGISGKIEEPRRKEIRRRVEVGLWVKRYVRKCLIPSFDVAVV